MRQQLVDAVVGVREQPLEHILEVSPWIVPMQLGRVHQTHDHGRTLAGQFTAGEQPCLPAHRPGAHEVLDMVVVDAYRAIVQESPQCLPTSEAVVQRRSDAAAVGHACALQA